MQDIDLDDLVLEVEAVAVVVPLVDVRFMSAELFTTGCVFSLDEILKRLQNCPHVRGSLPYHCQGFAGRRTTGVVLLREGIKLDARVFCPSNP